MRGWVSGQTFGTPPYPRELSGAGPDLRFFRDGNRRLRGSRFANRGRLMQGKDLVTRKVTRKTGPRGSCDSAAAPFLYPPDILKRGNSVKALSRWIIRRSCAARFRLVSPSTIAAMVQ